MEEIEEKQHLTVRHPNGKLTFIHPNGDEWFDLTKFADKYRNYLIRDRLGNNDSIHKINLDGVS